MNASEILPPGHVFHGRYEVVRCLKLGGMGAVYEVVHRETRRRRALKVMLPSVVANRDMHARFLLEARIAADVESEHIVEIFDAGVDEHTGAPFLVMELLRGEDLASLLARSGPLPAESVVGALAQVAGALSRTHAAGVVHRDLKPENLFVGRRDDGSPKIKILDFGIAKVVSEGGQAAARTKIMGTPLYMSPEQIRGDGAVDSRADLYALAHIAFTLLVGRTYWEEQAKEEVYALMLTIAAGQGEPASAIAERLGVTLPAAFDAWFARATAADPRARFASAPLEVEALAAALGVPAARASGSFAWPSGPSSPDLETASFTTLVTSPPTETSPAPTSSTTSLDPATVTGPRPSEILTHPSVASPAPADAAGAGPMRGRRRRTEGVGIAVAAVALAVGLVVGHVGRRAPQPAEEARAPAAAAKPPAVETQRPAPPRAPESRSDAPPAATSHRLETPHLVAPRPRPVRPAETAKPAQAPSALAPAAIPDESVLLLRK